MNEIEDRLRELGYNDLRWDTSKTISIMSDLNRVELLETIANEFSDMGAEYGPWGSSSVGSVKLPGYTIRARPKNRQGRKAPGLENEEMLLRKISEMISQRPKSIRITDGVKTKLYRNVVQIKASGYDTKNRKKADVLLFTENGDEIPISIKKSNADAWESADVLWGEKAMSLIHRETKRGTIELKPAKRDGAFSLSRNIATRASLSERRDVVFGSDILDRGFVAVNTFSSKNFLLDNDTLHVHINKLIDNVNDLCGKYEIFFLVRNNLTRNAKKMVPGLRAQAVQASRITRNTLVV